MVRMLGRMGLARVMVRSRVRHMDGGMEIGIVTGLGIEIGVAVAIPIATAIDTSMAMTAGDRHRPRDIQGSSHDQGQGLGQSQTQVRVNAQIRVKAQVRVKVATPPHEKLCIVGLLLVVGLLPVFLWLWLWLGVLLQPRDIRRCCVYVSVAEGGGGGAAYTGHDCMGHWTGL